MAKPVPVLPGGQGPGPSALADAWVRAIEARNFVSAARADLYAVLSGAAWWFTAVVEGRAEEAVAEDVGAELVAAHLTDHNPIGAHSQGIPHQIASNNRPFSFNIGRARFQSSHMGLLELQLGRILNGENPFIGRDKT